MKKIIGLLIISLAFTGNIAAIAATSSKTTTHSSGMNMSMPAPKLSTGTAAMMGGTLLDQAIPATYLNIPLQDASGKTFSLASLKGKSIVLTDFFTSCDMICPMTTANMRDIGDTIAKAGLSKKFAVVELSIDPQRDTVSRIHTYQALYGEAKPSWTVATGSVANLKKLWSFFGVYTQHQLNTDGSAVDWQTGKKITYDVVHADIVLLIDSQLHYRWLDLGNPAVSNPNVVPAKLKAFLSESGLANLKNPQQPDWDPSAVYGAIQQVTNIQVGPKMKMKM